MEDKKILIESLQEAVRIESTWWALVEIPQQNRAENFASYVLRVCNTIDSVRIPLNSEANSFRESEREKDARVEKVNGKKNTRKLDTPRVMVLSALKSYLADSRIIKKKLLHSCCLLLQLREILQPQ